MFRDLVNRPPDNPDEIFPGLLAVESELTKIRFDLELVLHI